MAIKMWSQKTGGLWWQVHLVPWNIGPSAKSKASYTVWNILLLNITGRKSLVKGPTPPRPQYLGSKFYPQFWLELNFQAQWRVMRNPKQYSCATLNNIHKQKTPMEYSPVIQNIDRNIRSHEMLWQHNYIPERLYEIAVGNIRPRRSTGFHMPHQYTKLTYRRHTIASPIYHIHASKQWILSQNESFLSVIQPESCCTAKWSLSCKQWILSNEPWILLYKSWILSRNESCQTRSLVTCRMNEYDHAMNLVTQWTLSKKQQTLSFKQMNPLKIHDESPKCKGNILNAWHSLTRLVPSLLLVTFSVACFASFTHALQQAI